MTIKRILRLILLVVINYSLYSGQVYSDYESMLKDFKDISYDVKNAKSIQSFILPINYGEIYFEEGTYYPLTPMNGKVYGGLFVGSGNFEFSIPNTAEKRQLKRFYQRESINSPIEWALVFSANDLNSQLMAGEAAAAGQSPSEAPLKMLKYCNLTINTNVVNADIAKVMLEGEDNNYTYHIVKLKDISDPLIYEVSPRLLEPVMLHRVMPHTFGYYSELINQYYPKNEAGQIIRVPHDSNYCHPQKYSGSITFTDTRRAAFDMKVDVKVIKETGKWIKTDLFPKVKIEDIRINGEKVYFYKDELYSQLFIRVPKSFSPEQNFTLEMKYEESLTYQSVLNWYPVFGSMMKSQFEITAKTPNKKDIFRTVGDEIEKIEQNGMYISKWKTSVPVYSSDFFLSPAYEASTTTANGTVLNVVYQDAGYKTKTLDYLSNAYNFFSTLLCELPNKKINTIDAFRGSTQNGFFSYNSAFINSDRSLSAGSVASLWYSDYIRTNSYRESWLHHGLNHYLSMLYLQSQKKDSKELNGYLIAYSKSIRTYLTSVLTESKKTGIASIGYRNSNEFWDVVIFKSTWVMHMLRVMMIDFQTMNEDVFVTTMRDFFKSNAGREVTTQDFIDCVERNTKFDFSWFFDQWLNTNDIPTYKYAYKTEKVNGKYITKFKVKQENVPADFKMLIPIALIDDDKKVTASRTYITGAKTVEFELAPTDTEPDEVIFNYLEGVLCELDEEGWNSL